MDSLVALFAKLFIARTDVKARQFDDGSGYAPVKSPWTKQDLLNHLSGRRTFGHYLLDQQNECKVLAFDIDIKEEGAYPFPFDETGWDISGEFLGEIREFNPLEAWADRSHPSRSWIKLQLKTIAAVLCRGIRKELELPCAVAYSGHKGLHVYGLTGGARLEAWELREGAKIVLDSVMPDWKPLKGDNFYHCTNADPAEGFPNFCIEIYPKQNKIEEGGYGNLLRLPLGRNLKSPKDPTFFVNMADALTSFAPVDPVWALTTDNPFKAVGE